MAQIILGPSRAYPNIPSIGDDVQSHSAALNAIIESLQIHERRTNDVLESFVRVGELETLGIVSIDGNVVSDVATEESTTHHHDSTYLRLDGTNDPVTGSVSFSGGLSATGLTAGGVIDMSGATSLDISGNAIDATGSSITGAVSATGAWTFTSTTTFRNDAGITIESGDGVESFSILFDYAVGDYYGVQIKDDTGYGIYFDAGGYQYTVGKDAYDTYVDSSNPTFGDSLSYSIGFINEGWNASLAEWGFYGDTLFQFGQYVIDGGWGVYVTETTAGNWKYPMGVNTSQQETLLPAYPLVIGNSGGAWAAGLISKGATYATLSENAVDFSFALTGLTDLNFTGMTSVNMPALDVTGNIIVGGTVDGRDVLTDGTVQDAHIADATIHFTQAAISIPLSQLSDVDDTGVATNDLLYKSAGDWVDTGGKLTWDPANGRLTLVETGAGTNNLQIQVNATNANFLANADGFSFFPAGAGTGRFYIGDTYSSTVTGTNFRVYANNNIDYAELDNDNTDFNIIGSASMVDLNITGFDNVDITGNIVISGTVDGRDVATDGSTQDSHIADATIHFTEASIDHGSIAGLADDDHPQYGGIAQVETITGAWTFDVGVTFTSQTAPTYAESLVWYDSDHNALSYYNDEADIEVHLGQDNIIRVRNSTGVTITKGSICYITGATGNRANITLAQADVEVSSDAVGIAMHDIENNSDGYLISQGILHNVDTSGTTAGDDLWLSDSVAGGWTTTQPTTGYNIVVGHVLVVNPSTGKIAVNFHANPIRAAQVAYLDEDEVVTGAWDFSAGIDVTGNITVTGTVDGRDVATDGSTQDSHIADGTIHFTEASIDHTAILNIGTNTHAQIDTHIADGTIHFTEASIDHTAILNIGTNTHAQIDTHIADGTIHFTQGAISIPLSQASDVTITTIASGELLKWDGAAWINNTLAEAGVSATGHTHVEADITDLGTYLENVVEDTTPTLGGNLAAGGLNIDALGDIDFGSSVGIKASWYGSTYTTGVEANTLYHRASTNHRWYIGVAADGGVSHTMSLNSTSLFLDNDAYIQIGTSGRGNGAIHMHLSQSGTDPGSPAGGDLWFGAAGLKFHDGTTTHSLTGGVNAADDEDITGQWDFTDTVRIQKTGEGLVIAGTANDSTATGWISFEDNIAVQYGRIGKTATGDDVVFENTLTGDVLINAGSGLGASITLTPQGTGAVNVAGDLSISGNTSMGDSDEIQFGASGDAQMLFDGTRMVIDVGTPDKLYIRGDQNSQVSIHLTNTDSSSELMSLGYFGSTQLELKNEQTSGTFAIVGVDSGAADSTMLDADPDGALYTYYDGVSQTATQSHSAAGNSSGMQIKNHIGSLYDVGFNVMPVYEIDAADSFDVDHQSMLWHKDTASAVAFTCENSTDMPNGATWVVMNDGAGDVTIVAGAGATVYWIEAGGAKTSGTVTVEEGGLVTVYKYSTTVYYVWGAKEAGGGGGGATDLDGLSDVTLTSPADDSIMIYDSGTAQWRDYTLSGDLDLNDVGVTTLQASAITGKTAMTSGLVSTDELLVSNSGVLNRMDISVIQAYMQANLTGLGSDADTLDGLDSTQFLRSDVADDKTAGDLGLYDSVALVFGTGNDLHMEWTGTYFDITTPSLSAQFMRLRDGLSLRMYDTTDAEYMQISNSLTSFQLLPSASGHTLWLSSNFDNIDAASTDADFDAITGTSFGGILSANLVDKSATETITGTWTIGGVSSGNLVDKSAAETVSGLWYFTYASEPAPAAGQSALTSNFLHIDGKEAIDGNDTWLRINQNSEFSSGVYIPTIFQAVGTKATFNKIFLNEAASATTDVAGDGQIWVKSNAPNDLYYTGDTGIDYPVGYATYRKTAATTLDNNGTTETIGAQHVNGAWFTTAASSNDTLTLETSGSTNFPVGAQLTIWNAGSGTTSLIVAEGASGALYIMDGSSVTLVTADQATIAVGGYATLIRESTTVWRIMGAGVS